MTTDHKKPTSRALCCEKTWPKGHSGSWPCANPAKVIRDGKPYCGVHDPVKVKARWEQKSAEWKEQAATKDAARAKADADSAERDRRADCYDDLLDALGAMVCLVRLKYGNLDADIWGEVVKAEEAIAKAKGEPS